eukprot:PhM_4_TR16826/c2_g7_i2/m.47915
MHNPSEIFLGDMGYVGCKHILHPYKTYGSRKLTAKQKKFNDNISNIRARVERYFSFLNIFRCFTFCDHEAAWLQNAMTIATNIMYCVLATNPQYEVHAHVNDDMLDLPQPCTCGDEARDAISFRDELLTFTEDWDLKGKKPRNAKRPEPELEEEDDDDEE